MARNKWSDNDVTRYDHNGEPPRRLWSLFRDVPVVPLSFLNLWWMGGGRPKAARSSTFQLKVIEKRPATVVICDLYPESCLRSQHARFVIPSDDL